MLDNIMDEGRTIYRARGRVRDARGGTMGLRSATERDENRV